MRILLVWIVLAIGCGISPRTQFPRYYYGMDIITFEATYPNLETFPKKSPSCGVVLNGISHSWRRYILPDKRVMQVNLRNGKIVEIYVRQPKRIIKTMSVPIHTREMLICTVPNGTNPQPSFPFLSCKSYNPVNPDPDRFPRL